MANTVGLRVLTLCKLLAVAEAGKRGTVSLGDLSPVSSASPWFLDALRFQERLSLRRSELMDEGVAGSSGVGGGPGDFGTCLAVSIDLLTDFLEKRPSVRLPVTVALSPLALDRFWPLKSYPVLGRDDDRKGEMLYLLLGS